MARHTWVHRRLTVLSLVLLVPLLAWPAEVVAAPVTVTHEATLEFTAPTPCLGENVHISGTWLNVFTVDVNPAGKLHYLTVAVFLDIEAVGVITGTVFNPTGQPAHEVALIDLSDDGESFVFARTNRMMFVSQGAADNFIMQELVIFTVNANGDVAVDQEQLSVTCVG